jgi:hypothetical protein
MTPQQKMDQLVALWATNPILGIKQLFGVEPTEQQVGLILSAWKPKARAAASSAQGAGKTATLTWLTFLLLLTQHDCRILITSPSYQQLSRVFSSEIHKWHSRMPKIFQEQFIITKERISLRGKEGHQFASLVTASAEHEENLQGGHSENYVILADEASGIEEHIFDVLLGTLGTGLGGRFILTSNPLRSSGRFYEIFGRDLANWDKFFFSAYDSPILSKEWIEEMKETYGEDSDIFRVRVLGRFPRRSSSQFFDTDIVTSAMARWLPPQIYEQFPKYIGVDVARFGDDKTVFALRQGPKLIEFKMYDSLSTMEVVGKLVEYQNTARAQLIFIDAIGIGAGVYDRAKELELPVDQVIVSQKPTEPMQYFNLRAQLYGETKKWLENNADLPKEDILLKQFLSMEYGYNQKMQLQLMGKKEIKARGLDSPDIPDAIALTFKNAAFQKHHSTTRPRPVKRSGYLWV